MATRRGPPPPPGRVIVWRLLRRSGAAVDLGFGRRQRYHGEGRGSRGVRGSGGRPGQRGWAEPGSVGPPMAVAVSPGRAGEGGRPPIRDLGSGPALPRCPVAAAASLLGRGFVLPSKSGPAGALQRCQSGAVSAGVSSVAVCAGCGPVGREEATVVGETSIEGARAGSVNRPAPPPGLRGIRLSPLPGGLARPEGEEKGGSFSPVPRSCGPVGGIGGAGSGAVSEGGQGDRG